MNKIFIILIALILTNGVKAQIKQPCSTCLAEGITFTTQAQIDSFQVNYPNCTQIEADVTINGEYISNLDGLNVITYIGADLNISFNLALTSLTGLENLTFVGGNLNLTDLYFLTSLTGLENLTSVGGDLSFTRLSLTSLTGLENLTSVGGDLLIADGYALTSLTGLNNVTSIAGYISIESNDALNSLTGLEGLTSIGGELCIWVNNALTSLAGLEGLTSIGGNLRIISNDSLTSLTELEGITSIGADLIISGNYALTSLAGLEGLTSIGGILSIGYNQSLTSLIGLEGLTSIGGYLYIANNVDLTCLSGLGNINAYSIDGVVIHNNISLSDCAVQSICDYLATPNGWVEIGDNATGCDSQEEVEAACGVGVNESAIGGQRSAVKIFPNPAYNSITFELPSAKVMNNTTLSIYNVNAQRVILRLISELQTFIDIGTLPCGVYFVRVSNDNTVQVGKFVKQ